MDPAGDGLFQIIDSIGIVWTIAVDLVILMLLAVVIALLLMMKQDPAPELKLQILIVLAVVTAVLLIIQQYQVLELMLLIRMVLLIVLALMIVFGMMIQQDQAAVQPIQIQDLAVVLPIPQIPELMNLFHL